MSIVPMITVITSRTFTSPSPAIDFVLPRRWISREEDSGRVKNGLELVSRMLELMTR